MGVMRVHKNGLKMRLFPYLLLLAALVFVFPTARSVGRRSLTFSYMVAVPYLRKANKIWPLHLSFFTWEKVVTRDSAEKHWQQWVNNLLLVLSVAAFFVSWSRVSDFLISKLCSRVNTARCIRSLVVSLQGVLLMWYLYGIGCCEVLLYVTIGYILVELAVMLASLFRNYQNEKAGKAVALIFLWTTSLCLTYYFKQENTKFIHDFLMGIFNPYALEFRKGLPKWARLIIYGRGAMGWTGTLRFLVFRIIDYGTVRIMGNMSTISSRENLGIWEFIMYFQYTIYPPLLWQGPIVGYWSYMVQLRSRYSQRGNRIFTRGIPWLTAFKDLFSVFVLSCLKEIFDHNWYPGMFFARNVVDRMESPEIAFVIIAKITQRYIRFIVVWRFFRVWAAFDGVEVPENFRKCIFTCTTITEFWRNFNASVHEWSLRNIVAPLNTLFGFGAYIGTVATFLNMWWWHGVTYGWFYWALINSLFILVEQFAMNNRYFCKSVYGPKQARMRQDMGWGLRITYYLGICSYWFIAGLTKFLVWHNLAGKKDVQHKFGDALQLYYRIFIDDSNSEWYMNRPELKQTYASMIAGGDWKAAYDMFYRRNRSPLTFFHIFVIMSFIRIAISLWDEAEEKASLDQEHVRSKCDIIHDDEPASLLLGRTKAIDYMQMRDEERYAMATALAQNTMDNHATICHILKHRAKNPKDMNRTAFVWLEGERGHVVHKLTYKELHNKAVELANSLKHTLGAKEGDRAVLVYPPGLDFIVAMFGCMYARVIAIPVYPPDPFSPSIDQRRTFEKICNDAQPVAALSNASYLMAKRSARYGFSRTNYVFMTIRYMLVITCLIALFVLPRLLFENIKITLNVNRWHILDAEIKEQDEPTWTIDAYIIYSLVLVLFCETIRQIRVELKRIRAKFDNVLASNRWLASDSGLLHLFWRTYAPTGLQKFAQAVLLSRLQTTKTKESSVISWLNEIDGNEVREKVAYLQYTSGSTAQPKGVMITHGNIMHQGFGNQISFGCLGRGETGVNWCPQYHDLGLVVCILGGVFTGIRLVCFSPFTFLSFPVLWIRIISRYRARFSAAPNFAYSFTAKRVSREIRSGNTNLLNGLDLSCWKIAGNGGEPVREKTLRAFLKTFQNIGFDYQAPFPCFGLAEHTIMVSGRQKWREPTVIRVCKAEFQLGKIKLAPNKNSSTTVLVGCGEAYPGVEIIVVDPESSSTVPENEIGEVWIRSPSVGKGYWGYSDKANQPIFEAVTKDANEDKSLLGKARKTYLRTGDLGFIYKKEIFICGRLKDLIIVDGRNIFPQDIESLAESCNPLLTRAGCSAVFEAEEACIVLVMETKVAKHKPRIVETEDADDDETLELHNLACIIFSKVLQAQRISLSSIVFLHSKTLPKTSSGKIRRRESKRAYTQGLLTDNVVSSYDPSSLNIRNHLIDNVSIDETDPYYSKIVSIVLRCANVNAGLLGESEIMDILSKPLSELISQAEQKDERADDEEEREAFSSLDAVHFASKLEKELQLDGIQISIPPTSALVHPNVASLCSFIYSKNT